jgi:hypothetical protein
MIIKKRNSLSGQRNRLDLEHNFFIQLVSYIVRTKRFSIKNNELQNNFLFFANIVCYFLSHNSELSM